MPPVLLEFPTDTNVSDPEYSLLFQTKLVCQLGRFNIVNTAAKRYRRGPWTLVMRSFASVTSVSSPIAELLMK